MLPKVGDKLGWWRPGLPMPLTEGEYEVVGIWEISPSLSAIRLSSPSYGESLFLCRDGVKVGIGTYPSQACVDMYVDSATVHNIGCNDLEEGELEDIKRAWDKHRNDLPEY